MSKKKDEEIMNIFVQFFNLINELLKFINTLNYKEKKR